MRRLNVLLVAPMMALILMGATACDEAKETIASVVTGVDVGELLDTDLQAIAEVTCQGVFTTITILSREEIEKKLSESQFAAVTRLNKEQKEICGAEDPPTGRDALAKVQQIAIELWTIKQEADG